MVLTHKQKIGQIGENIAVKHLVKHNFKILDRNYRKKWGEIDIIAEKNKIIHFIEVKSVSCALRSKLGAGVGMKNVSIETLSPEENVHFWKKKRLARAIKTYLAEKNVSFETDYQIGVMAVFIDLKKKKAKIRFTGNVII